MSENLKIVFLEALKVDNNVVSKEEEVVDMSDYKIPLEEIKLVDLFLKRFTILSENSINEHLDILLMLKALPNKIMKFNLDTAEMFNFKVFQEALIAF